MNNNLQEIATNIFEKYLNKTLFTANFAINTCEFYNFVENIYSLKNLSIKIFRKNIT